MQPDSRYSKLSIQTEATFKVKKENLLSTSCGQTVGQDLLERNCGHLITLSRCWRSPDQADHSPTLNIGKQTYVQQLRN